MLKPAQDVVASFCSLHWSRGATPKRTAQAMAIVSRGVVDRVVTSHSTRIPPTPGRSQARNLRRLSHSPRRRCPFRLRRRPQILFHLLQRPLRPTTLNHERQ